MSVLTTVTPNGEWLTYETYPAYYGDPQWISDNDEYPRISPVEAIEHLEGVANEEAHIIIIEYNTDLMLDIA